MSFQQIPHVNRRQPIHSTKTGAAGEKIKTYEELDWSNEEYNGGSTILNTSSEYSSEQSYEDKGRERSPENQDRPSVNKSLPNKNIRYQKDSYSVASQRQSGNCFKCALIGGVIAIFGIFIYIKLQKFEKKCSYANLKYKYPEQDTKMWRTISIATENILNERLTTPAVNLFVHQGGKGMEKLVRHIAEETAKCFGGESQLVQMDESDFTSPSVIEDYGNAVEIFKSKIQNKNVAVIVNLNMIPPEAARALHSICDTYSPIAEKIAIFLTLVTPTGNGNPIANAENTLKEIWGTKLKRSDLDPLITRVTDQVLALKSLN